MEKRFIVLGLGSFGSALAKKLSENGCRVTGVDFSERQVDSAKDFLYEAVVGDVTDRGLLEQLLLPNATVVFISLGESIERSILCALHARELGARQLMVKGISEDHGRILKKLGVDRVIFPEVEIAMQVADEATWPNVIDFLRIDPEYSIIEIAVPGSLAGITLLDAKFRSRFNIYVLAVKDALTRKLQLLPPADFRLSEDQLLIIIGKQQDLDRFRDVQ